MPFNLLPGHQAPEFHLVDPVSHTEIELSQNIDGYGVLLFWDEASPHELFETIEKYLERIDEFMNLEASLIGFSNAKTDQPYVFDTDGHEKISLRKNHLFKRQHIDLEFYQRKRSSSQR